MPFPDNDWYTKWKESLLPVESREDEEVGQYFKDDERVAGPRGVREELMR